VLPCKKLIAAYLIFLQIYQVNIIIFALAILATFCGEEAKQVLMKIVGSFLAGLMIFHDVLPLMLGDEHSHNNETTVTKTLISLDF
jgi:hypothetical protein